MKLFLLNWASSSTVYQKKERFESNHKLCQISMFQNEVQQTETTETCKEQSGTSCTVPSVVCRGDTSSAISTATVP